jgi:hypothetical protein
MYPHQFIPCLFTRLSRFLQTHFFLMQPDFPLELPPKVLFGDTLSLQQTFTQWLNSDTMLPNDSHTLPPTDPLQRLVPGEAAWSTDGFDPALTTPPTASYPVSIFGNMTSHSPLYTALLQAIDPMIDHDNQALTAPLSPTLTIVNDMPQAPTSRKKTRQPQNSVNPPTAYNAKLSSLHSYNNTENWKALIEEAKAKYQCFLAVGDAFPTTLHAKIEALDALSEQVRLFENKGVKLEEGAITSLFPFYITSHCALLSSRCQDRRYHGQSSGSKFES